MCECAFVFWIIGFSTETRNIEHGSRFITLWFDKNFILFGIVLYFAFWIWLCVCVCLHIIQSSTSQRCFHILSKKLEVPWAIYLIHLVMRVYECLMLLLYYVSVFVSAHVSTVGVFFFQFFCSSITFDVILCLTMLELDNLHINIHINIYNILYSTQYI